MNACPVCHKELPVKLRNVNGFNLLKCSRCGLLWVPDVDSKTLEKFYSKEYFRNPNDIFGYHNYIEDEEILRINARYILSNIPLPHSSQPKLLDIGCAYGFLLDEARKTGWDVYGVELNKEAAEYAEKNLRLNVTQNNIMQAEFPKGTFDAVVIIGSLEHFPNPVDVIRKAHQLLKQGGHLAITTINTKGWVRLFDIKPPEHLFYFSSKNLSLLLELNRFEVTKRSPYWCHYHLNEALCRAYRLIFKSNRRIEEILGRIPFLKICMKVPTNEMFILSRKK